MFGALYAADGTVREALEAVAREFSPRIERHGDREITLDLSGLTRLFGDARTIAHELRRTAADRDLRVRVAIAGTRTAARLLVRERAGISVVEPGTEAAVLATLPLRHLATLNGSNLSNLSNLSNDLLETLRQWGLRTLGDFAALPAGDVAARLGQDGVAWQRLARGDDPRPLVPAAPDERFEQALDLEWPIEGLEPLSFVLGRLLEPLSAHLERRGRGAAVLHVRLHLVNTGGVTREVHERSLQLPAPIRDARTLRTLALLDLESHPPAAAIDRVIVAVDPTPGRVIQGSLLTRPLPTPEQLSTLMARLGALMGEGRSGAPAVVDTWEPGAFAMRPFAPRESDHDTPRRRGTEPVIHDLSASVPQCVVALRRLRFPVPARVRLEDGRPVRLTIDRASTRLGAPRATVEGRGVSGGRVTRMAGPWRTSGAWWSAGWDRDEWDVTVHDGATYRVFHERGTGGWFLEGIVD